MIGASGYPAGNRFRRFATTLRAWHIAVAVVAGLFITGDLLWGTGVMILPLKPEVSEFPRREPGGMEASWAYLYTSLADMCTHSDSIIIGTVDRIIEIQEESKYSYRTYWSFKIEETLKGEKSGRFTILQSGSPDKIESYFRCDPPFLEGERYLLFLRETESGEYWYHPQARFLVWNGWVYSMNYVLSEGAALRPVPEMNCYGRDVDEVTDRITGMVDSLQVLFTHYNFRSPGDVTRYSAGVTIRVFLRVFTGNNGPGTFIYSIDPGRVQKGFHVSIEPSEFSIEPYSEYESVMVIRTDVNLPAGSYPIPVEYELEGACSGERVLTYNVNAPR